MKQFLFAIAMTGFLLNALSQQVPNGSFELWTGNTPDYWDTSNENIFGTQYTCVSKVTNNVQHGTAAVKVTTERRYVFLVGYITLPGILTLGDFVMDYVAQTGEISGGEPFSFRPTSLKGYYKRTQVANDSALVGFGFSKWNPVANKRDTVALGVKYFYNTASNWTEFEIPIDWTSPENPDTFNIIIASSDVVYGSSFTEGSTIWIDNLHFEYVTVGGDVTGPFTDICEGENTGLLTLSGQTGSVLKWEKRVDSGNWVDIPNSLTSYSEIPTSPGLWEYRALLKNDPAPEEYSAPFIVNVHQHFEFSETHTIQQGSSFTWHGNTYTQAGTYYDSLLTVYGCDSIHILHLDLTGPVDKTITINLFLEGLYLDNSPGMMKKAQNETGDQFPADIADEITVEFRMATDYSQVLYSSNANLITSGIADIIFPSSLDTSYYITVKHRNSIETTTSFPISLSGSGPFSYNFSTSAGQAYGNNLKPVTGGYFAIFSADVNQDGIVDGSDLSEAENASNLFQQGYYPMDVNGDGIVDGSDMSVIENNSTQFIQKIIP